MDFKLEYLYAKVDNEFGYNRTINQVPERKKQFKKYYSKFSRYARFLLEYSKPIAELSDKGKLNKRSLHKTPYSDKVFNTRVDDRSSRTTAVILIDASGSMQDSSENSRFCKAVSIASAFAEVCKVDLRGEMGVEVFTKLQGGYSMEGLEHSPPFSFRVYSSALNHDPKDMLNLVCGFPDLQQSGSGTPENGCLPGIIKFAKRKIPGNLLFVNLTDGQAGNVGIMKSRNDSFNVQADIYKQFMRIYDMYTILIGYKTVEKYHLDNYGKHVIAASDDSFAQSFFRTLKSILDNSVDDF
jgi:hypothetical protein